MQVQVFKSKIHRAVVTQADLNYIGSITIDGDLIDACGILENERVQIVNCNNGERLETYVIRGEHGSGVICLNGAAARKAQPGDVVIIISYGYLEYKEAKTYKGGTTVFVNEDNTVASIAAPSKLTAEKLILN
ncbi:MAG: aspartate 1-decarboxylase [Chitinophagales bacterium]